MLIITSYSILFYFLSVLGIAGIQNCIIIFLKCLYYSLLEYNFILYASRTYI